MSTLYIIGAGSSKNYKQSVSPVPGLEAPVNTDFFKMAKKVIDYYDLSWMMGPILGLHHFVRNINQLFGYGDSDDDTSSFLDKRLSLEEIMVHFSLEYDILNYNFYGMSENSRTRTLNELLAYTLAESLSGEICKKHVNLARKITNNDVIWNFNYDILMDNALRAERKFNDSGYKMRFDYAYDNAEWQKPNDIDSSLTMLKLHGSINWIKCNTCGAILLLRSMKDVPALWTGIKELDIACPRCKVTKYTGLERYIIPPGLKVFTDVNIRYLWRTASNLKNIDKIIAIGYSFSDSDPQVRMLLRVMRENKSFIEKIPITIVTHNKTSYKKIKLRVEKIFPDAEFEYAPASTFY